MADKMSRDLGERFEKAGQEEAVPVIVTLRRGADVSAFELEGFEIRHRYESIPAVAGTLKAGKAERLAALDEVSAIESDEGEVRAL